MISYNDILLPVLLVIVRNKSYTVIKNVSKGIPEMLLPNISVQNTQEAVKQCDPCFYLVL